MTETMRYGVYKANLGLSIHAGTNHQLVTTINRKTASLGGTPFLDKTNLSIVLQTNLYLGPTLQAGACIIAAQPVDLNIYYNLSIVVAWSMKHFNHCYHVL